MKQCMKHVREGHMHASHAAYMKCMGANVPNIDEQCLTILQQRTELQTIVVEVKVTVQHDVDL